MRSALVFVAACVGVGVCLAALPALAQSRAAPQPKAEELKPGLSVAYKAGYVQGINQLTPASRHAGPPLPHLNYVTDLDEKVLTSDYSEGVAADIKGYIRLDKPGAWVFQVNSNDGVMITLGGKKIIEDPFVHSDQMSKPATVQVSEPGWYELRILYFQRKGTAALQLHWTPPGGAQEIVPAEAYAYVPD